MTGLQAAMLAGLGLGIGLVLLLVARLATSPNLGAAMANLTAPTSPTATGPIDLTTRFGAWARATLPGAARGRTTAADLNLLGIDPARHTGDKVLGALGGLFAPTLITAAFGLLGIHLPAVIPLVVGVGFAALLLLGADQTVARRAAAARVEVRAP